MVDLAAFDEVMVERIVCGQGARGASCSDRTEAIRRMTLAGFSDGQIAFATGMWRGSVWKIRTERLKLESALGYPSNGASCIQAAPTRPKVSR